MDIEFSVRNTGIIIQLRIPGKNFILPPPNVPGYFGEIGEFSNKILNKTY